MKQHLFLLATLFAVLSLPAQTISFDLQPEGKGTNKDLSPQFIGCDGQRIVLVESTGLLQNHLSLVAYGLDQKELARTELGTDKESRTYGGFINGQHIDLLRADFKDDDLTGTTSMTVYRDRRNLSTLQPAGDTLLLGSFTADKGDDLGFGIAVSPNGELLAGVFVARRKALGTEVKVGLYNHELEEYWLMPVNEFNFNEMSVTDEGDVILYRLSEKCFFTLIDGEHAKTAEFTLSPDEGTKIVEREFVRYGNDKILVAASVREENHTFMPEGANIDRVDIHCFNIKDNSHKVERHPFTDQECHRLCNTKEGKSPRHHWVQFGQLTQTLADKEGAYVMVDQTWSVSVNGIKTEWHRAGMMVMRVDENGRILWTRTQRLSASTTWEARSLINHRWVSFPDGIMIAWVDHAGNITTPLEKPFKEYKPSRTKGVLNVWTLSPSGKETRSYTQTEHYSLTGTPHQMEKPGKYACLLSSMRKGRVAFIEVEN